MSTLSPFEIGRAIGSNVSRGIRGASERSSIDDILEQANASGNPEDVDNAIGQILTRVSPERQQAALQVLGQKQQQIQSQQRRKALESQGIGGDIDALDPALQKEIIKAKSTAKPVEADSKRHVQDAFNRVSEILESGNTGFSPLGITPQGRQQRAELDTLSEVFISNLIPLLNPKGTISKERFNYIKNLAPSSWDTDAKIKGKLKALSDIFGLEGSMGGQGGPGGSGTIEMKDAQGNIYDIPQDMVEKARAGGLQ